jgi:DnaJ like chaperone protein
MAWNGKVAGGILGLLAGGPIGALIGVAFGHQFDRGARDGGVGPGDAWSEAGRRQLFFTTTFQTLGALAKADGHVSSSEIDAARSLMREMRLEERAVRAAIDCFTAGKAADFPLRARVRTLREACADRAELLRTFLEIQVDFLLGKEQMTERERAMLLSIATELGVGQPDLAHLEAVLRARRAFRRRPGVAVAGDGLADAFRALGLEPAASDAEIKAAYRRLMNQHHPDKQAARGLPESMLEAAKERTHEIRAAYDLIRARRSL